MNNFDRLESNIKKFNKFLTFMGLINKGQFLVEADRILTDDNCMSGGLLISKEKIVKIISEKLQQQPNVRIDNKYSISSFNFFGCGWIIIEEFDSEDFGNSFMTLQNKWW